MADDLIARLKKYGDKCNSCGLESISPDFLQDGWRMVRYEDQFRVKYLVFCGEECQEDYLIYRIERY